MTHGNPTSLSISPAALFWGIASAFAAAFYTTYPSTLIARYGTLPVVGWSMLIGGLILLPFYARQGTNFVVNGSLILAFFYLVVIGTSLTFSLYLKGAQLIGGPKASILSCAEPFVARYSLCCCWGSRSHYRTGWEHCWSLIGDFDFNGFPSPRQKNKSSGAA
ncbi:EamA family transporter [Escherichia coli]